MKKEAVLTDLYLKRTRQAFMFTSLLNMPFWAIYAILPFILHKDLRASAFQISLFMTLKPLVSVLSVYWSNYVKERPDRLIKNVIWAGIIGNFPFFLFPFIENPWFVILSSPLYTMLSRGVIPAWMEILKLNIPEKMREKVFSKGAALSFLGGGFLSLGLGALMDDYYQIWRWIFPVTALLNISAIFFQCRIVIPLEHIKVPEKVLSKASYLDQLLQPWKGVWRIIMSRPDFAAFQLSFMLGGFGLMVIQPALPVFFMDVLKLTYTELTTAFTLCKGIAFAASSPFWAKAFHRVNIFRFLGGVTWLAFLFPLLLIGAKWHIALIGLAYLNYGFMQAGSELSWHLSGPIFAKGEDSSSYSSVNVALVGLRGCIAPLFGSLLVSHAHSVVVLLFGSALSLAASLVAMRYSSRYAEGLEGTAA